MTLRDIESSWIEKETGILNRLRRAADRLERHVIPIFHAPSDSQLLSAGSGVLARLQDRAYLLSAAHVFDHCDTGVFVPTLAGTIDPLVNPIIVSALPPGKTRHDDRFDIGFVRLTAAELEAIGSDRTIDLDVVSGPRMPVASTIFVVLGFPHRDHTWDSNSAVIVSELTSLTTGVADDLAFQRSRLDQRTHLLLRYDRRMIATRKAVGAPPKMTGISGGGAWPVRIDIDDPSEQTTFFAGIVTERPARYKSALAVTRGLVVRAFVRRFDRGS